MTITISNAEFVQYHNIKYSNKPELGYIREYINSKGSDFQIKSRVSSHLPVSQESEAPSNTEDGQQSIELSTLIIDSDTLERNMAQNDDYKDDENVRKFIEAQKAHKLRFLQEVEEKGLRTEHNALDAGNVSKLNY